MALAGAPPIDPPSAFGAVISSDFCKLAILWNRAQILHANWNLTVSTGENGNNCYFAVPFHMARLPAALYEIFLIETDYAHTQQSSRITIATSIFDAESSAPSVFTPRQFFIFCLHYSFALASTENAHRLHKTVGRGIFSNLRLLN